MISIDGLSANIIGLVLQLVGLLIIFASQMWFLMKCRREYNSVKKAFLSMTCPQLGIDEERLKKMSKSELDEKFRKFRLAQWLLDDFKITVFGLIPTLVGILLQLLS
jgi:hypothetical protein